MTVQFFVSKSGFVKFARWGRKVRSGGESRGMLEVWGFYFSIRVTLNNDRLELADWKMTDCKLAN